MNESLLYIAIFAGVSMICFFINYGRKKRYI